MLTAQRPAASSEALARFVEFLRRDAEETRGSTASAREHYILTQLGDFGQHPVYRRAAAVWEDPRWIPGGRPRGRLQDNLTDGAPSKIFFRNGLLQLTRDINDRYGSLLNLDQVNLVLEFVRERHHVSHAHLTKTTSFTELLKAISTAKILCMRTWPPRLALYRKVLTQVVMNYEALVVEIGRLGLQESDEVVRGGRFTGWLWEIAGLLKEEREKEREKNKHKNEIRGENKTLT